MKKYIVSILSLIMAIYMSAVLDGNAQIFAYAESNAIEYWAPENIHLSEAWEYVGIAEASTVKVAIIDSGIDITHPYLAGRVDTNLSKNFCDDNIDGVVDGNDINALSDPDGHGTHVAGIILQTVDFNGANTNIELVSLRVHPGNEYEWKFKWLKKEYPDITEEELLEELLQNTEKGVKAQNAFTNSLFNSFMAECSPVAIN